MKPPPDNPEFARFTEAMRTIVKVPKVEMQRRIEAAKRRPKGPGSRSVFSPYRDTASLPKRGD